MNLREALSEWPEAQTVYDCYINIGISEGEIGDNTWMTTENNSAVDKATAWVVPFDIELAFLFSKNGSGVFNYTKRGVEYKELSKLPSQLESSDLELERLNEFIERFEQRVRQGDEKYCSEMSSVLHSFIEKLEKEPVNESELAIA